MTRWTSCRANGQPRRRVVVTGLGVVSPIGIGQKDFAAGLRAGRLGVRPVSRLDASALPCRLAAEVDRSLLPPKPAALDWATHYAAAAASEAVADAELDAAREPTSIGVSMGATKAGPELLDRAGRAMRDGPHAVPDGMGRNLSPGAVAHTVAEQLGLAGPCTAVAAACSTGAHNIIWAAEMVAAGRAEAVVAGSTDAPIVPSLFAAFANLRNVMTTHNERGATAVRPFCATRDGLAMGEGAGAVVVEALEHARARGACVYAELAGWTTAAEAAHITSLPTDTRVPVRAIGAALAMAQVDPTDIDYVCAHGTATERNDPYETDAYKAALGGAAGRVPISSIKAMLGHCMAAAAAIDAVGTLVAMAEGFVPPTGNYYEPDPRCDLDYVPNTARSGRIGCALSPSFAFGGHIGVLLFRRP
ncbi:MAG: beta-ketoacyl-[acyl-carrier-protein] synthase family protein [Armatimonadota bacterium]